jgi:cell wall-associated NlpC family hydrolase
VRRNPIWTACTGPRPKTTREAPINTGKSGGIGRRLILFVIVFAALGLALGQLALADPGAITQAQQEAQTLQARIDELADQLDAAIEDYNYSIAMLNDTQVASENTQALLTQAESDLAAAEGQLVDRLVEIYKEGQLGGLEALLGSDSFSEVLDRLDWLKRMSGQDAQIVADVQAYTDEKSARAAELAQQLQDQQAYAAQADAAKASVEQKLAANEGALADKKDEIAQLVKEEEARQARLLAEAKKAQEEAARKAAELAAQEAARKAAELAAQEKARQTATTKKPTTPTTKASTTRTTEPGSTTATTAAPDPGPADPGPAGPPDAATADKVVSIGLEYLGRPYVWAASGPDSFDCSGFVMYVYKKVGISLPHSSRMQAGYGVAVSRDALQPGDLIFFYTPIHHVAIYIGDGKMVHAAGVGKGVRIDQVWARNYNCARRIL